MHINSARNRLFHLRCDGERMYCTLHKNSSETCSLVSSFFSNFCFAIVGKLRPVFLVVWNVTRILNSSSIITLWKITTPKADYRIGLWSKKKIILSYFFIFRGKISENIHVTKRTGLMNLYQGTTNTLTLAIRGGRPQRATHHNRSQESGQARDVL